MPDLLWLIVIILVIMWAGGLGFGLGGSLIHLILLVAVILLVINLLSGRGWRQ